MPNEIANNMADTINQLERQLQTELDKSRRLEIELREVKKILKKAVDVVNDYACGFCSCCKNYKKGRCLVGVADCQRNDKWEWIYEAKAQKRLNSLKRQTRSGKNDRRTNPKSPDDISALRP